MRNRAQSRARGIKKVKNQLRNSAGSAATICGILSVVSLASFNAQAQGACNGGQVSLTSRSEVGRALAEFGSRLIAVGRIDSVNAQRGVEVLGRFVQPAVGDFYQVGDYAAVIDWSVQGSRNRILEVRPIASRYVPGASEIYLKSGVQTVDVTRGRMLAGKVVVDFTAASVDLSYASQLRGSVVSILGTQPGPRGSVLGNCISPARSLAKTMSVSPNGSLGTGSPNGSLGTGSASGSLGTGSPRGSLGAGSANGSLGTGSPRGSLGTGSANGSLGTGSPRGSLGTGSASGSLGTGSPRGSLGTGSANGSLGTGSPRGSLGTGSANGSLGTGSPRGSLGTGSANGSLGTGSPRGSLGTGSANGSLGTGSPRGSLGTGSANGSLGTGSPRGSLGTGSANGSLGTGSPRGSLGTGSANGSLGTGSPRGSLGTGSANGSLGTGSPRGSLGTGSANGSLGTGSPRGSLGTVARAVRSAPGARVAHWVREVQTARSAPVDLAP